MVSGGGCRPEKGNRQRDTREAHDHPSVLYSSNTQTKTEGFLCLLSTPGSKETHFNTTHIDKAFGKTFLVPTKSKKGHKGSSK